jgi:hypothetical protein
MRLPLFFAALMAAAVLSQGSANAQTVTTRSGVETRVGSGWNCSKPNDLPLIVETSASHGSLVVRRLPSGAPGCNGPINVLFYTSAPGYKGPDVVMFLVKYIGRGGERVRKDIIVK